LKGPDSPRSSVLVVEDEQGSARFIASLCEELGLAAEVTGSGREAIALAKRGALDGQPFACLVVDIVLAEADGFQVAQAVRGDARGAELPIVVISGVYKQLPQDFAARVRPQAFLAKPFEPSRLRETLRRLCKVRAPGALDGDVREKPVAALLIDLLRQKATGLLALTQDQIVRTLHLQAGMVRFAQSNVRSETIGAPQIAAGLIKQASFDRAAALADQQKLPLHETLASARVFTLDQLKVGLKQQTQDVVIGALGLAMGTYSFEPLSAEQVATVPDVRVSPVVLVLEQARHARTYEAARKWLETRQQARLTRSADLERELFALKSTWPGESVTALANSGRTLGEILPRVKASELPLLYALCVSGLIAATTAAAKSESKTGLSALPDLGADKGKQFAAREEEARASLFADRERLEAMTHYEVLGIANDATPDVIKLAWFRAAKRYHSDSFSGLDLGSAKRVAEELFSRVNEANAVLASPEKRADYDVFLDRKAKGLPTDVAVIFKAEAIFQKGETFFKAGKWHDAETAFREAIALNDSEAEFHAYLGITLFRAGGKGKAAAALEHVNKALQLDDRLSTGHLFAALLKDALGEKEEAKKILRKLIEQNPEYAEARAELSRIRSGAKPEEANKGGFLGRLLKK
jgi:curved DNA-binding protein CbpA/DNA-binding response OmpR family regulator